MMELAARSSDGAVQLHSIAKEQQLSVKYLEQIVRPLRLAGLIVSERGSSGGYRLGRPASEITALDIVQAVEGPVFVVDCVARPSICPRSPWCVAHCLWGRVGEAISGVLAQANLAEMARLQQATIGGLPTSGEVSACATRDESAPAE
jgi:Rrf2 family protein